MLNEIQSQPETVQGLLASKKAQYGYAGLHVGCGKQNIFEDFVNVDLDGGDCYLDATKPFDIESDSVDYIYSEHFIEHLRFSQGESFLKESYRVMQSGGRKRVLFPDLSKLVRLALDGDPIMEAVRFKAVNGIKKPDGSWLVAPKATPMQGETWDYLDDIIYHFTTYWGHEYMWSANHLKKVMEHIGFSQVKIKPYAEGEDHIIVRDPPQRWGAEWTSVVEAIK